ncbi:MAG TPA: hypothetical protein VH438_09140 [Gemmatimonadales bacterium]
MNRHWVRLKALVLFAALVGGGFGLPVFDALAFHSKPGVSQPQGETLSAPGRDVGHGAVCALSLARNVGRCTPAIPTQIAGLLLSAVRTRPLATPVLLVHQPQSQCHSRAPPASL